MVFRRKKKEEVKRVEFEEEPEEDSEDELEDGVEDIEEIRRKAKAFDSIDKSKGGKPKIPELPKTWTVKQVATQTQPIIINQKTDEQYDLYSAVVEILNRLEE